MSTLSKCVLKEFYLCNWLWNLKKISDTRNWLGLFVGIPVDACWSLKVSFYHLLETSSISLLKDTPTCLLVSEIIVTVSLRQVNSELQAQNHDYTIKMHFSRSPIVNLKMHRRIQNMMKTNYKVPTTINPYAYRYPHLFFWHLTFVLAFSSGKSPQNYKL